MLYSVTLYLFPVCDVMVSNLLFSCSISLFLLFFFFFFLFLCLFVISSCICETKQTSNNATAEAEVKSTLSETQEADKQKWLSILKDYLAFVTAGGVGNGKEKTPELQAWSDRLGPALKEFNPFLQDENSSWWKSDKEFAMLLVSLIPTMYMKLSDELKNELRNEQEKEKTEYIKANGTEIAAKLGVAVNEIVS